LLPLLYPTGHLPSPRWRVVVVAIAMGMVAISVAAAFNRDALDDFVAEPRPLLVLPTALEVGLIAFGLGLLLVTAVLCVGNAVWRLWRARQPERAQLALLLVTATAATLLAFLGSGELMFGIALAAVPVAVVIGVLRYGLLGIQIVLRPALLYGSLTLLVAVVFAGVTAGLSALLPAGPLAIFVAAGVVAVVLVPAHARLRRFVVRLVDGPSADPLQVLAGVGQAVTRPGDTSPASDVVAAVADAVGAPYVALRDPAGRIVAQHGQRRSEPEPALALPLAYAGEDLGTLEVTPPPRGFSETGIALLGALAPQVAVLTRAVALNTELEEARRHLLDASQAERARLRRDLHDGIGPSLSGVALGIEAAQSTLRSDPARAAEILDRLRTEVSGTVEEIRRIIDGLRPPALDSLGLVGALRTHAVHPADRMAVAVISDAELSPLDPEVEAAAYRIALEAVTNARRHAAAGRCTVRLSTRDNELRVEISDDGHGLPAARPDGVGLTSMRHRAERLDGEFDMRSGPGGTTVVARLPRHRP
ncbi:MAG TPA: sensor histidine kinase, partial [Pilimelia sp.]|nr:sensor histidine kinase [Pilimelia sp.]